jgi:hypothetical protein
VPIEIERYARIGDRGRMLHENPIFTTLDLHALAGGPDSASAELQNERSAELPTLLGLADRLLTIPALTDVPDRFVRDCAAALRKVAACAASMGTASVPSVVSPSRHSTLEITSDGMLDAGSRAGARISPRRL